MYIYHLLKCQVNSIKCIFGVFTTIETHYMVSYCRQNPTKLPDVEYLNALKGKKNKKNNIRQSYISILYQKQGTLCECTIFFFKFKFNTTLRL